MSLDLASSFAVTYSSSHVFDPQRGRNRYYGDPTGTWK